MSGAQLLESQRSADVSRPTFGPMIFVDALLEEQPVKALVDTSSPVSIVSIKCLFDVMEKLRTPGQSVEEWKKEMKSHFQSLSMTVNNYGVGEVIVIPRYEYDIVVLHEYEAKQSTSVNNYEIIRVHVL